MRIQSTEAMFSRTALRTLATVALAGLALMAAPGRAAAARRAKANAAQAVDSGGVSPAIAQVVYPLDQKASAGGYRCVFLGNAFFINEDGYLLTAAHVVSWFRQGGQPYILAGPADGPRHMLAAEIVAADWAHDVVVLRVAPTALGHEKREHTRFPYMRLAQAAPAQGGQVVESSLMSSDVENTYSADAPVKEVSAGQVLRYQMYKDGSGSESELVLTSATVEPGQSGSPLVAADSQGVVGIIVGRWLHPAVLPAAADGTTEKKLILSPGAALRIDYGIRLLNGQHVAWHPAARSSSVLQAEAFAPAPAADAEEIPEPAAAAEQPVVPRPAAILEAQGPAPAAPQAAAAQAPQQAPQAAAYVPPMPVSVTGTYYPPDVQLGGEVLLDALVGTDGKLGDIQVVSGKPSYVKAALSAVEAWSFQPAQANGQDVEARIGIVFQFPQGFLPPITSGERQYEEFAPDAAERGALPVLTEEAVYPFNSVVNGSVALYEAVDADGQVTSSSVLVDVDALTQPAMEASYQWRFAPGKRGGENVDSTVIVVTTFRRPGSR